MAQAEQEMKHDKFKKLATEGLDFNFPSSGGGRKFMLSKGRDQPFMINRPALQQN